MDRRERPHSSVTGQTGEGRARPRGSCGGRSPHSEGLRRPSPCPTALLSALSWRLWMLQGLYLSLCDWALPAARFCPWQLLLGRRCSLRDMLPRRWFQPGSTEMLPRRWQVWNSPACGRCHVYRDELVFRSSMTFIPLSPLAPVGAVAAAVERFLATLLPTAGPEAVFTCVRV